MKTTDEMAPRWKCWVVAFMGNCPSAHRPAEKSGASPAAAGARLLLVLSLITGLGYPLLVTGIAHVAMRSKASGSILLDHAQPVGSKWVAQRFVGDRHFWPRPSAGDDGVQYTTIPSFASNFGPTSSNLAASVRTRLIRFRMAHNLSVNTAVPSEMIFASGSGLDPHISPASARMQVERVAKARGFDSRQIEQLRQWVEQCIENPQFGFLGEPRINVLHLNLGLEQLQ